MIIRKVSRRAGGESGITDRLPRRGFTLTELLTVITIIAMLAALLLPALTRAKAEAESAACKSRLHQMGIAQSMYLDDFHVYPLYQSFYTQAGRAFNWSYELLPYYRVAWTNVAFHCPAYKGSVAIDASDGGAIGSYAYNTCGVMIEPNVEGVSLGLDGIWLDNSSEGRRGPPIRDSSVVAPSHLFAIMDARVQSIGAGVGWAGFDLTFCYPSPAILNEFQRPPQHGSGFNVLHCDGHVALIKRRDLFNPTNTARNWNNDDQPHQELWER